MTWHIIFIIIKVVIVIFTVNYKLLKSFYRSQSDDLSFGAKVIKTCFYSRQ
jgi:hypothetical protein